MIPDICRAPQKNFERLPVILHTRGDLIMIKHKYRFLYCSCLIFALIITISGCRSQGDTFEQTESTAFAVKATEPETQAVTETLSENEYYLTEDRDSEKVCLCVRPTGVVTAGDDFRYYTPQNQEQWLKEFEAAVAKADYERHWEPGDSSTGLWLRYQSQWWKLLVSGELLAVGSGRIASEEAKKLYDMCMEAAAGLNLGAPVRPEHIKNIQSATLHMGETYTITDPKKLNMIENWLSNSKELHGGASCWFTARLTLKLKNGGELTIATATDSCCTWMSEGVFYDFGAFDNEEFYCLFTETEESETATVWDPQNGLMQDGPAAYTPKDDDFVRVRDYIPNIRVDLPYATSNNFTNQQIYHFTDVYLRYGTVKKLSAACEDLEAQGLYLKIWDGYRPVSAQGKLWDAFPDPAYVSPPDTGNRMHCRGSAVDLTLVDETGSEQEMPSGFDDFSSLADRDYSDCTATVAENAMLLQSIMEKHGFKGYSGEWWHFNDETSYPIEEYFEPVNTAWYYADCNEYISLRTAPSTAADVIVRIPADEKLQVLAVSGRFSYVSYQTLCGYVLSSYLIPVDES